MEMMDATAHDDGQLLTAFAESGDELAFAAIVERHSGQVRSTARRVLGDADEAQDIAQAVFLTLARKARSLRKDLPLAGWLHRVAWRLALNAMKSRERRRNREELAMQEREPPTTTHDDTWLPWEQLDAAIERMPARYRLPLVLFHLEGCSLSDVAERLALNPNTVGIRLNRARNLLRRKLVPGGATVGSLTSLLALITAEAEGAGFPPALVSETAAAGLNLTGTTAGGAVSAKVAALTDSALKMLFWAKVKTVTAVCAVAVLVGGAGVGAAISLPLVLNPEAAITPSQAPTGQSLAQGGQVWAWGINQSGQLGDGTTNNSPVPVLVSGLDDVTAVAAGGSHTVALQSDHTVWAWGSNGKGQLGDGTTAPRATPVQVQLPDGTQLRGIVAVAAGQGHTVALSEDSTVWTWGGNMDGQLGDGTRVDRLRPTRVAGLSGVAAIAAGTEHTMALKTDTTVWMWGKIRAGSRGLMPTPEQVKMADGSPLAGVSAVAAGQYSAVALRGDCSVWIWGELTAGRDVPVQAKLRDGTPISEVVSISACSFWMVLLKNDGSVWERELSRDAKSGLSDSVIVPVQLAPGGGIQLSGISAIAVGWEQALALRRDGSVWVWRQSITGPSPVEQVRGLANAVAIAAGARHGVALTGERPPQGPVVGAREESNGVSE